MSVLDRRDESHGHLTNYILADCADALREGLWHEQNTNVSLTDSTFADRPQAMEHANLGWLNMMFLCSIDPDPLTVGRTFLLSSIDLFLSCRSLRRWQETFGVQVSFLHRIEHQ